MMERRKSFRLSFRKKNKSKKNDADNVHTENSVTNLPVVLAENERLRNENTFLKGEHTRLRQKLEFKEAKNRNQSNDYVFPGRHRATVEQEDAQTDAEVEADAEHSRMNDLGNLARQLDRHMSLCESHMEDNCKLRKRIESLAEEIKELTSSGQKYNASTITKDKRTWSNEEVPSTVDSRCPSLDKLDLFENHKQTCEMMEELLATCLMQQQKIQPVPDRPQIMKIPLDIKTLAWKLQKYMVTMEKVKDFGRHLGLEPDLVNRLADENKHSKLDAFWSSICCWCKEHGAKASVDLLQQSCIKAKIDVFSCGLLPESHRQALEMTIPDLEEDLLPSSALSHLRSKGVLGDNDVYYVMSQVMRRDRVTALVSLLPLFGEEAFDVFLDALEVSSHPHLAEALKDNLARCSSSSKYGTTSKHYGRRGQAPVHAALEAGTVFQSNDIDLLFRILADVRTSSKHTEAMMLVASENSSLASPPGSQMSTLSMRSDTGTMTRAGQYECIMI